MPLIALIAIAFLLRAIYNWLASFSYLTWGTIGASAIVLFVLAIVFIRERPEQKIVRERAEQEKKDKEALPLGFEGDLCHQNVTRGNLLNAIAISPDGRRIATFDRDGWFIRKSAELLSCDIDITHGEVTTTTSSRSLLGAAVGGLAFGAAGAVVGGLGGKTQSKTTSHITGVVVRLAFKDIDKPIYEISFPTHDLRPAYEWIARFNTILSDRPSGVSSFLRA